MFEVLVYVYENYFCEDSFVEPEVLTRKLTSVGFSPDEIGDAVTWLNGLSMAARGTRAGVEPSIANVPVPWLREPLPTSFRIYSTLEQRQLGTRGIGYLMFLEAAGLLPAPMREVAIDRAIAAPLGSVGMADLKTILLMVYWSFGCTPSELLLDELCADDSDRLAQ